MSDVPQLHDWLNRPHVAERWDNAMSLVEVEMQYRSNLASAFVFPFIVELDGKPIGFIQSYNAELVGEGWWQDQPPGTWGVDQYLGDENLLGKGIGSQFIREFTDNLLKKSEVKRVITDPAPDNGRAIRAYEKAGFIRLGITQTPDGPAFLMEKCFTKETMEIRPIENGNLENFKLGSPAVITETPRLLLRKIQESDFDALLKILGDPEVMRFSLHGAEDHDGVRKFLESTWQRYERDGVAQWAVVLKETGACIGECGISVQIIDGIKEYEIGYRLAKSYWGQGLATEAAKVCRDLGFGQLVISRLISIIEAENKASIRVAEKVGMRMEKESAFHGISVKIYSLEMNPERKVYEF